MNIKKIIFFNLYLISGLLHKINFRIEKEFVVYDLALALKK
jgi:hypothetical protein